MISQIDSYLLINKILPFITGQKDDAISTDGTIGLEISK